MAAYNSRLFRNQIEEVNRYWLSREMSIPVSLKRGIDLLDGSVGIELKSRYNKWYHAFSVHEYQIDGFSRDNPGRELFWAFMFYDLKKEPKDIKESELPDSVTRRDMWFFEWDWIRRFLVSDSGREKYVYVNSNSFPPAEEFSRHDVEGASFFVPKSCIIDERLEKKKIKKELTQ
jgi:hypothetical protein